MATSFITVINNIISTLQNNSALVQFCHTEWNKVLSVKKVYRRRTEINIHDMPIILITRPNLDKSFLVGARDGTHILRFYVGFHQPDREKALDQFIEFEEKIDDALMTPETETLGALNINSKASVNDEGDNHPTYFMVMDIEIKHRR